VSVRTLEPRDVDAVLAIQAACPEIAQWSRAEYNRAHTGGLVGWVAERIAAAGILAESALASEARFVVRAGALAESAIGSDAGAPAAVRTDGLAPSDAGSDAAIASTSRSDQLAPSVVGFIVARTIPPEIEVLNFAVAPSSRRHGVGADLFDAALDWARSSGLTRATLEVRAANAAALRLYHRRNFQIVGRRPRYYANPTDDALLLTASLD
jgi:ribosomal protein S18 acetylase RimI-like enzyme